MSGATGINFVLPVYGFLTLKLLVAVESLFMNQQGPQFQAKNLWSKEEKKINTSWMAWGWVYEIYFEK